MAAFLPGLEPPPKPHKYPAPEPLVRQLMALGVSEPTARSYSLRQAHAVLRRREADRKRADQIEGGQEVDPPRPRADWQPGVTAMERAETAAGLAAAAADDTCRGPELVRLVQVALAGLDEQGLRRCATGVARLYGWADD